MKRLFAIIVILICTNIGINAQIIAPKGTHTIENTLQALELNCSAELAYSIAYRTGIELNWVFSIADSKMYTFGAKYPQTMKRWSDDVNIYFDVLGENKCIINVKSKLGHKPNKEYITTYLQNIEEKSLAK